LVALSDRPPTRLPAAGISRGWAIGRFFGTAASRSPPARAVVWRGPRLGAEHRLTAADLSVNGTRWVNEAVKHRRAVDGDRIQHHAAK
jgi:hypothetical protein